jgi:hypothetical protein
MSSFGVMNWSKHVHIYQTLTSNKKLTIRFYNQFILSHVWFIVEHCEQFFDTCHFYKKKSFITHSQIKQLGLNEIHITLHFTCHTMKIYDIELKKNHKIRFFFLIIWLTFATNDHVIVFCN